LDANGRKEAKEAAEFLKDKGITMIYSSDLERAMETAFIIANELGLDEPWSDFRLRPWNVGEFSGKNKDEHMDELMEYVDNPSWDVPGGESLDKFIDRIHEAIEYYIHEGRSEGIKLLVTHTSDVIQLDNYVKGKSGHGRPEKDDTVEPGGIVKVSEKKGKLSAEPVLREIKGGGKAEYGS